MMHIPSVRSLIGGAVIFVSACGTASPDRTAPTAPTPDPSVVAAAARADSVRRHYTPADITFMTGMIHHHAQALVMARMAESHGASPALRTLAGRIINSQRDEIHLMQRWLRERGEPVPEVDEDGQVRVADGDGMDRGHHAHDGQHGAGHAGGAPMAGMLTPDQLRRLDAARGQEWNRLFLTYMIQHHQGAVVMVDELFATDGAAQGDETFEIAAMIGADQASEIDRMQRMLTALVFGDGNTR
jgi:uncharacterized protein (DUF305 family)